jgi:hypothetical protein
MGKWGTALIGLVLCVTIPLWPTFEDDEDDQGCIDQDEEFRVYDLEEQ